MKPTRIICATKLIQDFVEEYFYLNPISQVGLVVTRNKRAELISELAGNPRQHIESIKRLSIGETECSGEPSLQNSLELTIQTLRHMPAHASREVSFVVNLKDALCTEDTNLVIYIRRSFCTALNHL